VEVTLHAFLISELDEGEIVPDTHLTRGWVSPTAILDMKGENANVSLKNMESNITY